MFVLGSLVGIIFGSLAFMDIYRLIVYREESFLSVKFKDAYTAFCADVSLAGYPDSTVFRRQLKTISLTDLKLPLKSMAL